MSTEPKQLSDWTCVQELYEAAQAVLLQARLPESPQLAKLREAVVACDEQIGTSDAHEPAIMALQNQFQYDDDRRIDDCPLVSEGDVGIWVSGCFWIETEETPE
jgi:hypothetical protein